MFLITREDNTAVVNINTGKGNTFSLEELIEFKELINVFELDNDIYGLIITGTGHAFSIGGNLEFINTLRTNEEIENYFMAMDELLLKLFSFTKPLCAAINGHAIGLGFLIMLCSDFIVCSDNPKIKFGLPEIKIGMTIDSLMCEILEFNQYIGSQLAQIVYSAELFDLSNLEKLNLIKNTTQIDKLISSSKFVISELFRNNINSFTINKTVMRKKKIEVMNRLISEKCYEVFFQCLNNKVVFHD